jgi:beta-phosphoglucomutase
MNYKAIIFDMDGTIVNTEKIWEQATRKLIECKGFCYTDDLHKELSPRLVGLAMHKSCSIIKDVIGCLDSVEELVYQKQNIAHELYAEGITFIEGFIDFHHTLAGYDLKSAIATSACDKTIVLTDQALNLKRFFGDHMYGISCVGNICKPDPAIYLYAADQLCIDPKECIAIEDSAHGIASARAAGMYCIGIATSHDKQQTKEAHERINGYHEIDLIRILQKKQ